MKKALILLGFFCLIKSTLAQTAAPYQLSPKWVWGNKGYFDFTSGALVQVARTDNIIANEGSSTLCDSLKNVAIYNNNVRIAGNNFVPNTTAMVASSSSDQGGVIIPDPSNPYADFYCITGNAEADYTASEPNDLSQRGLRVYSTSKAGTTVTAPSLVSILEPNPIKEYVYTSTDDNFGYWIITAKIDASITGNTSFYAWPVPAATGTVGGRVTSTTASNIYNEQYQGAIKVNRCQTLIAFAQGSCILIYDWNRSTGQIGTQRLRYVNPSPSSKYYGCEFSANSAYLYVTTLDKSGITRVNIGTGAVSMPFVDGSSAQLLASGSLQIAPNDVIYVANGLDGSASTVVGTITNANTGGTYNPSGVTLANSSSSRLGISNIPWLNPRKPTVSYTVSSCLYTMTPHFLTYFKDIINIDRAEWDFGDGSAHVINTGADAYDVVTHGYSTTGSKTVTLTVRDATCSQSWVGTQIINVSCPLPVELINFTGLAEHGVVRLNWSTITENNNDYFEIQRSLDDIDFIKIGEVDGKGNSNTLSDYSYQDEHAGEINYYRLIQHDFDGASTVSNTILVNQNGLQLTVYPNPTHHEFHINIANAEEGDISVYNLLGEEVFNARTSNTSAQFTFGSELTSGYYTLKYTSGAESKSYKLEKF